MEMSAILPCSFSEKHALIILTDFTAYLSSASVNLLSEEMHEELWSASPVSALF